MSISVFIQTRDGIDDDQAKNQIEEIKLLASERGLIVIDIGGKDSTRDNQTGDDAASTSPDLLKKNILRLVAEYEREHTIARLKGGMLIAFENGKYVFGGTLPYGYTRSHGEVIKIPSCANTVETIFSEAGKGCPFVQIARKLTDGKVSPPSTSQNGWNARMVANIIRNPLYKGVVTRPGDKEHCRVNNDLRFIADDDWLAAQR